MKKLVFVVILAIGAVVVWKVGFSEPAPAKEYREHRTRIVTAKGFSGYGNITAQRKWALEITKCETKGSTAEVLATEITSWIPHGAAAWNFATILTKKYKAQLQKKNGRWVVVKEDVVEEDYSTYQDRKR
jgi:hypothetical protein